MINVCWLMSATVIVKTKFSCWSHDLMQERGEEKKERIHVVLLGPPPPPPALPK